ANEIVSVGIALNSTRTCAEPDYGVDVMLASMQGFSPQLYRLPGSSFASGKRRLLRFFDGGDPNADRPA
ncbi:MAG: hypothetical protein NTW20_13770, partial [Rhodobacterales bacterium]|nr:hypothetical protein [Rhodobacterales bacterium]